MTLRLRLVLGLTVLVLAGLTLFGVVTYSLYAHSQYQRLDDQVRSAAPFVSRQLAADAGLREEADGGRPREGGGPPGGGPPPRGPLAIYAELRDSSGKAVATQQLTNTDAKPRLASRLKLEPGARP